MAVEVVALVEQEERTALLDQDLATQSPELRSQEQQEEAKGLLEVAALAASTLATEAKGAVREVQVQQAAPALSSSE